jgi:two-component system, OmpR family, sensor histidine kinase CpxA
MRKFIFICFLAFGLISTIGGVWIGHSIRLAAGSFSDSDFVHETGERLVRALDIGGLPALEDAESRMDPKGKLRFLVLDSNLREVSGRQVADEIRAFAGRLQAPGDTQIEKLAGGLHTGSIVAADDGRAYRVIVRLPKGSTAGMPTQKIWAWSGRIAVMVAVAGLFCLWVAWRLSAPLLHLRRVARRFATGDLKTRAGASMSSNSLAEYKDLAGDFDEMAERIEALINSQRQLLRDVSHELRTPLTRLNLAINNTRHAPASEIGGSLDRIDQESERLNALIDRILRLSRLETFAEPPHHDIIELADFIESIVSDADFEAAARKRHVSIAGAEMCRLTGDRELLREAIENIVRNAIRYTPEGTAVTVDAGRLNVSEYRIIVRDCGPGVSAEHFEAIFEPFYRAPQRPDSPGFGVGLAIAKRAVALHQGTITAHNVAGGFEIAVHLPITGEAG